MGANCFYHSVYDLNLSAKNSNPYCIYPSFISLSDYAIFIRRFLLNSYPDIAVLTHIPCRILHIFFLLFCCAKVVTAQSSLLLYIHQRYSCIINFYTSILPLDVSHLHAFCLSNLLLFFFFDPL